MPFQQSGTIRYYTFSIFDEADKTLSNTHRFTHGVITRRGGVSQAPWASLNLGGTVGDDPQAVLDNRLRTFQALDRPFDSLFDVWQVHSREVVCAEAPRPLNQAHLRADAILTDCPGVTLFMRFADCVPILLYDPVRRVVGLVHAGWQGTVQRIAESAVQQMCERYGTRAKDILAGIGPSIGAHHYQVGPEVVLSVRQAFGDVPGLLYPGLGQNPDGKMQLDLWEANRLCLEQAGVHQIEVSGICTACHLDDWYSHRGEKGRTGRFGALIGL